MHDGSDLNHDHHDRHDRLLEDALQAEDEVRGRRREVEPPQPATWWERRGGGGRVQVRSATATIVRFVDHERQVLDFCGVSSFRRTYVPASAPVAAPAVQAAP